MKTEIQSGLTNINGADIYYEVRGQGFPLLLLHAGIADNRMWDDQVDIFAQHYQIIRFDYRGFGQSSLPSGQFSNVEDVRSLLDFLQIQQAYVLGISFGGLIAIDFSLTYPQMVKRLILGAPSVSGVKPSERIKQFWADEDAELEKGNLEAATEVNLRLWVDGPHREPNEVDPTVRKRVGEMQLSIFQIPDPDGVDEIELSPPAIERLNEIEMPTLIIVGSLDLEEKLTLADRLINQIPNASKIIMPDVAHMMSMEQPDQFNAIVLNFLKQP